jgi:hypothetical protein
MGIFEQALPITNSNRENTMNAFLQSGSNPPKKKFDIKIKQLPTIAYPKAAGFVLRAHQQKEYDSSTYQLRAMMAPGGSGKTVTQEACAVKEMLASGFMQRQLISAPQTSICNQFAKETLLRLECTPTCWDKKNAEWTCSHKITKWQVRSEDNLADDTSKAVLDKLENFIMRTTKQQESRAKKLKAAGSFSGLVLVTTHAAITRVFSERILPKIESGQYTKKRVRQAVNRLTNRTDESHHVGGFTETSSDQQNGLGRWLSFCYKRGDKTARIFFTTATPYREMAEIVIGKLFKKFKTSVMPFSQWAQYSGIETIRIVLEEFDGKTPIPNVAKNIGKEPKETHLVVHPRENEKWMIAIAGDAGKKKLTAIAKWKSAIKASLHDSAIIVDTIDPAGRPKVKRDLIDKPHDANVVLTCMVVREGVDVPSISRIHHTAMEQSKWLAVQTLYRAMREYPGKKVVEVRYYIPRRKNVSRIKTKEEFSKRVNLTLLLADLRDIVDPLLKLVDIKSLGKYAKQFVGKEDTDKIGLDDIFTVLHVDGEDIKEDVYTGLDLLQGGKSKAAMLDVIQHVLVDAGISKADVEIFKLDIYLLADYLLNLEEPEDAKKAAKLHKMQFTLRIDPMDYILTKFDGMKDDGIGACSGSYTPASVANLTKILHNWCTMMNVIEKKLAKVMHLPKSERYQALTPQERVWLKAQEHKEVL